MYIWENNLCLNLTRNTNHIKWTLKDISFQICFTQYTS
mgnify:FL=1